MPFQIIRNDITKVSADAIVNTANPEPTYASGTDGAIYRAAGARKLLAERKKIGRLRPGEAAVTPAFRLHAKYIIHTVGPAWIDGEHGELSTLASCYRKSLLLARQLGCRSIAFPLIATGVYGFPKDKALEIALREFSDFLQTDETAAAEEQTPSHEDGFKNDFENDFENDFDEEEMTITLVVFDRRAFDLSSGLVEGVRQYIDENYVDEQHVKEYGVSYGSNDPYAQERRNIELLRRRNTGALGSLLHHLRDRGKDESAAEETSASEEASRLEEELAEFELTLGDLPAPAPSVSPQQSYWRDTSPQAPSQLPSARPEEAPFARPEKAPFARPEEADAGLPSVPVSEMQSPRPRRSLQDVMSHVGETFQECLLRMIDERGLKDSSVYKRANIDRKLFSKIRCNPDYNPGRRTAIALGIALELNMDEMTDLLRKAGIALSPGSKFDLIIRYCVENRIYNIIEINTILFDYDQVQLG